MQTDHHEQRGRILIVGVRHLDMTGEELDAVIRALFSCLTLTDVQIGYGSSADLLAEHWANMQGILFHKPDAPRQLQRSAGDAWGIYDLLASADGLLMLRGGPSPELDQLVAEARKQGRAVFAAGRTSADEARAWPRQQRRTAKARKPRGRKQRSLAYTEHQ